MADFCRQCAIDMFGPDATTDYDTTRPILEPEYGYPEICEGCGYIRVNEKGECISDSEDGCLKGHGDKLYDIG